MITISILKLILILVVVFFVGSGIGSAVWYSFLHGKIDMSAH